MTLHRLAAKPGILFLATGLFAASDSSLAQNLLPAADLVADSPAPPGWVLAQGPGEWRRPSPTHTAGVFVVRGNGQDAGDWRTPNVELEPAALYQFDFTGWRAADASGGTAVAGPSRANRDFPLAPDPATNRFVFSVPNNGGQDFIRLGHWQVKGELLFEQPALVPVLAMHRRTPHGLELGEGESLRDGVYRFQPDFGWMGANYHRPLALNRAHFNSDRWVFSAGAEVSYRHRVPGAQQIQASLRLNLNYHTGGALKVEASRDGVAWLPVTVFDGGHRSGRVELPARLFPADEIQIRLAQAADGAGFQLNSYEYEARLNRQVPDVEGATWFLAALERDPELSVGIVAFEPTASSDGGRLRVVVTNRSGRSMKLSGQMSEDSPTSGTGPAASLRLRPGKTGQLDLRFPIGGPGERVLHVALRDQVARTLFAGQVRLRVGLLEDSRYGHPLKGRSGLDLWWCESGWKVGRDRAVPAMAKRDPVVPVTVSAARGEFEAVQVVLRPAKDDQLLSAEIGPFRNANGQAVDIGGRVDEVAYVRVSQPTDYSCARGWYPDPLPPLRPPLPLIAGENQPLWLTVHVPRETEAGNFSAELMIDTTVGRVRVPLRVHVYDFALPVDTHLRSALGLGAGSLEHYHRLERQADKEAVFENYLANFAEHRISPYSFYDYAPIELHFAGEGTNRRAVLDFTRFDAAATQWLDQHRFSTFQLPLQGMGGGTFQERALGELGGFKEGTPEHARLFRDYLGQVEQHLRERGWLDKAFTYWFDEPDPKDYEFVVEGMKRLKAAAPGVKRMLTEQPEPALVGNVDIWCGLTPEWTPEKVKARRDAGEQVWWYICTGPKAPFVTEFIDHSATELRIWPWQSWQYGVTGILIWATTYWTSPLAYPEPTLQDPWADPMSWVSGYGNPVGYRSPWGNGDGRFLYPPRRDPNTAATPDFDDPINSIRWENLREGMEDYEYLWLLRQAVEHAELLKVNPELVQQARSLLTIPSQVSQDLTHFTRDPRPLLEHRDRVARMIERLQPKLQSR
jgi:hypothetical protein